MSDEYPSITYGRMWWTSTWPLLVIAILSAAIDASPNPGAAFIWGQVLAGIFARKPVFTWGKAFGLAVLISVPGQLVLGAILALIFSSIGARVDMGSVVVTSLLSAVASSVLWALVMSRKARRLVGSTFGGRLRPVPAYEGAADPVASVLELARRPDSRDRSRDRVVEEVLSLARGRDPGPAAAPATSVAARAVAGSCSTCGGPTPSGTLMCAACSEFLVRNGQHSIHGCGGCGCGFLVAPHVDVFTFESGGVRRVFCACCHDHLERHVSGGTARMPPLLPGYDAEGQAINVPVRRTASMRRGPW